MDDETRYRLQRAFFALGALVMLTRCGWTPVLRVWRPLGDDLRRFEILWRHTNMVPAIDDARLGPDGPSLFTAGNAVRYTEDFLIPLLGVGQ